MSRIGRVGLSEFTTQRLAELRARRAESEAEESQNIAAIEPSRLNGNNLSIGNQYISKTNNTTNINEDSSILKTTENEENSRYAFKSTANYSNCLNNTNIKYKNFDDRSFVSKYPNISYKSPDFKINSHDLALNGKINEIQLKSSNDRHHNVIQDKTSNYAQENIDNSMQCKTGFNSNNHGDKPACDYNLDLKEEEKLGFASLPEQIHRKALKKGFDFTIMLVGDSGLGKSTFMKSLLCNNQLYSERKMDCAHDCIDKTICIEKQSLEIEEKGVKLRLTVIDTPGFNESLNATNCWEVIKSYLDSQFAQYLLDETGVDRRNISDNRVHCCLYFISPYGRGLRSLDIACMSELSEKVNIIPVIAKSDVLTKPELLKLKNKIHDDILLNKIGVYELPVCELEDDEETVAIYHDYKKSMPFAVASSNTIVEVNGKKIKGRIYPWGVVEVENSEHSDFSKLRQLLLSTHMQDLKDSTSEVHYENYRITKIQEKSSQFKCVTETNAEATLKQKEEELKKMQMMFLAMQKQLASSNATNC